MASTASACRKRSGTNSVSAGTGPFASMPAPTAAAIAGVITSMSSLPRWPDSPLCGLSPATRMRGRAMRKRRLRSASRTRNVSTSPVVVMARGTSARARCVVASATRKPPPTSIITTRAAPERSARYSVWPVKAMPASLSTLFCTGAVTMAAYSPSMQPRIARSMTTTSVSEASRTHSSGPIPAGSPDVSAMRSLAFLKPQFDVGLVAELPQPLLVGLVGLALAQRLAHLQPAAFGADVARAALEDLDQVVAERGAHRLAHLADLQLFVGALELRHRVAGVDPVELAAARRRAVVGMHARELGEVGAPGDDAIAQVEQLAARLRLGHRLARADQDVAHARLAHRRRLGPGAAPVGELQEVEAGRAAQGLADLAGIHLREHLGKELGQAVVAAPADRASLQRVGRVREARRHAREGRAAFDLGERLLGALARLADALGARALGHAHEDVGKVVLRALRTALLLLEEDVDFGLAHLHAVLHFALAQPLHQHLLAHVVAPGVEGHAVGLERTAKLGEGHVVRLRDALHGTVELQLVDANAGLARELELRPVEDQPLEHLPLEHRALRRRRALAAQLALGHADRLVELRVGNDFLVDHRHDAVDQRNAVRQ